METCIKCGKRCKNTFTQWTMQATDCDICEDCIKKHKQYVPFSYYSEEADMTFIFVEARVNLSDDSFVLLSQTLISYAYGHIEDTDSYVDYVVDLWLENRPGDRISLLRQAFNENHRNEEVLY